MYHSSRDQRIFLEKIQRKREEMFFLGDRYGLCASETIKCSSELDQLLNEYWKKFQMKEHRSQLQKKFSPLQYSAVI